MSAVPTTLASGRALVDPAMADAIDRLDDHTRSVVSYHLGWQDTQGHPVSAPEGKAVRPALALMSARAAGADPGVGLPGAVAVELVHNFSLLHDDVMDHDLERRHRATVWSIWGESTAILAGDALLSLAHEVLLESPSPHTIEANRVLAAATRELVRGQVDDLDFERRHRVSVGECLDMAAGKTGALLSASASIGAVLGGAPSPVVEALSTYGAQLGLAFQLVDDLLGIWGDPEVTGKPVLSDLRTRKKSLPIVSALRAGTPESQRLADLLKTSGDLSEEDLRLAAKLVEDAGGRAWCEAEAARQLDAAHDGLGEAGVPGPIITEFMEIAQFVTSRDR